MSLWGECETCGSARQSCICNRVRSMLSDALGNHYRADELMDHIVRVANHAAKKAVEHPRLVYDRIVCTNKIASTEPKKKKKV